MTNLSRETWPPLPLKTAMEIYYASQASSSSTSLSLASDSPATTPEFGSDHGDAPSPPELAARLGYASITPPGANSDGFILVIGGLGFIGSHTALELLKQGYNVIIVDNLSNAFESVLSCIKALAEKHCQITGRIMPAFHFHKLNYCSKAMRFLLESYSEMIPSPSESVADIGQCLQYRSRITGVIHFAAHKSVVESISDPMSYYENNVCGLVYLLRLLAEHNIRDFVFSSSATVYGTRAKCGKLLREEELVHHPETYRDGEGNEKVIEPSVAGLTSPYARTKYFCEAILADVAAADPAWRIVALRYFNPIGCDESGLLGEHPRSVATNLFPAMAQVLTGTRSELDIFGTDWETADGTAVRDFVHVSDIARGHIAALNIQCDVPFRAFNLGSGTGTTVLEAVRSLEAASSSKIPLRWAARRPGDVGFCVASTERAVKELGWLPTETVAKAAQDLWRFMMWRKTAMADEGVVM